MTDERMTVVVGHSNGSQTHRLTNLISDLRPNWTVAAMARSAKELAIQLDQCGPDICVLDLGHGRASSQLIGEHDAQYCDATLVVSRNPADATVAFDLEATDFVHADPLCTQRLDAALSRLQSVASARKRRPAGSGLVRAAGHVQFLKVIAGTRVLVAPVEDIRYLQAERKFTRVYLGDRTGIVKESLTRVYEHLDPANFWQMHRCTVVNAKHIHEVERDEIGRLHVKVANYPNSLHVAKPRERLFRGGFID